MKARAWIGLCCVMGLLCVAPAAAQSYFTNLNFELANVPFALPYGNTQPMTNAVPAWIGYRVTPSFTSEVTVALHNSPSIGGAQVVILGPGWGSGYGGVISGNYSVELNGSGGGGVGTETVIAQTGVVPGWAQSLQMKVWDYYGNSYRVSFGGVQLQMTSLEVTPNYTLVGADISAYANVLGELRISALPTGVPSFVIVDDILFSPQGIPEPSVLSLMAGSTLLLLVGRGVLTAPSPANGPPASRAAR